MTQPENTTRDWPIDVRASTMSDADLVSELCAREREWESLRRELEEDGGCGGSPGEWLYERMRELETEIDRRVDAKGATL